MNIKFLAKYLIGLCFTFAHFADGADEIRIEAKSQPNYVSVINELDSAVMVSFSTDSQLLLKRRIDSGRSFVLLYDANEAVSFGYTLANSDDFRTFTAHGLTVGITGGGLNVPATDRSMLGTDLSSETLQSFLYERFGGSADSPVGVVIEYEVVVASDKDVEWVLFHPTQFPHPPGGIEWREVDMNTNFGRQRFRYQVRYDGWVEVDSKTFIGNDATELQWKWQKTVSRPSTMDVYFPRIKRGFSILQGSLFPVSVEGECTVTTRPDSGATSRFDQTFQIDTLPGRENYRSAVLFASFKIPIEQWDFDKKRWQKVAKISGVSRGWTNVWFVDKDSVL